MVQDGDNTSSFFMAIRFDPLLNKVRIKDIIKQYSSDPTVQNEESWVLASGGGGVTGSPLGLLLALTRAEDGSDLTYQFSYKTKEATTKRVSLT